MSSSRNSGWIVVSTHPNRETLALSHLERQAFEAYCPMEWRRITHARRTAEERRPLFRGYLFVHVTNDLERWRPLLSTYGVRSVVRFGSRLGFVDTAFIDSLRAREIDGAIGHSKQVYSVGQDVQIVTGPFDGAITRIIEMNDRDRLIVLMNVLGGSVRVMLDTAQVQPARLQDPSGPLVA